MTGLEIVLLAGAGYLLYTHYQKRKTDRVLDLGGGLPTTDIESYEPSLVRARPIVQAQQSTKPTGQQGDQMLTVSSRKPVGPVGIVYTSPTGESRTVPEGSRTAGVAVE
jgi:hypothetical protein